MVVVVVVLVVVLDAPSLSSAVLLPSIDVRVNLRSCGGLRGGGGRYNSNDVVFLNKKPAIILVRKRDVISVVTLVPLGLWSGACGNDG